MSLFRKNAFFTKDEAAEIVNAIRETEKLTSGEIRVYIETKCKFVDPIDRAIEVFNELNMSKTQLRNGVLLYVATNDKQLSIYGDVGIHKIINDITWQNAVQIMQQNFEQQEYVQGFISCINFIGTFLQQHFPYNSQDKNELPDNIVFGK